MAHPGGRPSTYDQEHIGRVLELAAEGKSLVQIAAIIGVPRSTMQSWGDAHPEFSAALSRAKELEQAWWEEIGQRGVHADKFNSKVWETSMRARFRDEYTERKEVSATIRHEDVLDSLA
jgi:hypothetical protein